MSIWATIESSMAEVIGEPFKMVTKQPVAGGGITEAYVISGNQQPYFVKLAPAQKFDMFDAESAGLDELIRAGAVRVPKPLLVGQAGSQAFIVMEYIAFVSTRRASSALLGEQLAKLHQTRQDQFGWRRDNTIGSTPQINTLSKHWVSFWCEYRLAYQLALAKRNGHDGHIQALGEQLSDTVESFFTTYQPEPVLLHGDLWSGNYAFDEKGAPVIFDPAVYFGDHEADIAMTELFGGFSADFYAAYQAAYPLDEGYSVRKTLYNLYHTLNHLNLFGQSYYAQATEMMERLLAEVR